MTKTIEDVLSKLNQKYADPQTKKFEADLEKERFDVSNLTEEIEQTLYNMSASDLRSYFGYTSKEHGRFYRPVPICIPIFHYY